MKTNDNINHPAHYTDGKIEVIDYIEDKGFGYHLGNAIKYISRAGKKDPQKTIEDLRKAIWYIEREIDRNDKGLVGKRQMSEYPIKFDTPTVQAMLRALKLFCPCEVCIHNKNADNRVDICEDCEIWIPGPGGDAKWEFDKARFAQEGK